MSPWSGWQAEEYDQLEKKYKALEAERDKLMKAYTDETVTRSIAQTNLRYAESALCEAQKVGSDFDCWELIKEDGMHSDPDTCASCPYSDDMPELPCWVGKLKSALSISCTKADAEEEIPK